MHQRPLQRVECVIHHSCFLVTSCMTTPSPSRCFFLCCVSCGMRRGGFGHRISRCELRVQRVTCTGTRECTVEVKIVCRHSPAEPQHLRNGLLQRLVHVGLSFLLFHVLSSDSLHLSDLVSDSSPEPAPCELETKVLFMFLREGGLYLMAGTRTLFGVKTLKYAFDVKNAELHSLARLQVSGCKLQNLVRIDFSSPLTHVLPRIFMSRLKQVNDKCL